jgi:4-hydroxy-3-methylbut-2-enyl diphosphate reductase
VLVVVPLLAERAALGRRVPGAVRVGGGPRRVAAAADRVRSRLDNGGYAALLVTGTCGALTAGPMPGDLVIGSELRGPDGTVACPVATGLAGELAVALRRGGRSVHLGPIHTADHYVDGAGRAALADTGAIAVDTESALFAAAARDRPVLVVRAVSDTPRHPLRSAGIIQNGLSALRSLRIAAPYLADWSPAPGPADPTAATARSEEEVG